MALFDDHTKKDQGSESLRPAECISDLNQTSNTMSKGKSNRSKVGMLEVAIDSRLGDHIEPGLL